DRGRPADRGRGLELAEGSAGGENRGLRAEKRDGDPRRDRGIRLEAGRADGDRLRVAGLLVADGRGGRTARPGRARGRVVRCALRGSRAAAAGSLRAAAAEPQAARVSAGQGENGAARAETEADAGPALEPDAEPVSEAGAGAGPVAEAESAGGAEAETGPVREAVPLLEPRDGLPPLVETAAALDAAIRALAGGSGPVAVDAERASGFRYGHRAFLVQLRRDGTGTVLIDPVACPDLSGLDAALASTEAVFHAASQDLPCLAEIGYRPRSIFDTEMAGRLLGYPRVGLATLVEELLGLRLEKTHSAADWSTRPLPEEWLRYAALDVEVLVELRDTLARQLTDQGKLEWARQEFAAVLAAGPPEPRADPWRRTSGIHRVRNRRGLAVVRELWQERDKIAQQRDLSPTKVLPDRAIIE